MNLGARSVTQSNAAQTARYQSHRKARQTSPLVHFNVSGSEFYIHLSDLKLHPYSLLGSPQELESYYEPSLCAYFFDRNKMVFEYIYNFFQTGQMVFPKDTDQTLLQKELEFYRLQITSPENRPRIEKVVPIRNTLKSRIHLFLIDPRSSRGAAVWAICDVVFILISILSFILETEPNLKQAFRDPTHGYFNVLKAIEIIVTGFFTFDFVLRAFTWPSWRGFVQNGQNIVDFLSLIPFYAQLAFEQLAFIESGKILRVFRIFRVVKLFKYFSDMFLIIQFVCEAWQELILVSLLTIILLTLFGSVIYFAELDDKKDDLQFKSIMQGMWWSMVTITTVGYGDIYPVTNVGRFFGSVLVIISMVVLTLPMTVVISKFNRAYEDEQRISQRFIIIDKNTTPSMLQLNNLDIK